MIPIFDSKRQYEKIGPEIEKAVCEFGEIEEGGL